MTASLDMLPDDVVEKIIDDLEEDVAALQRLRLVRRRLNKATKEFERVERRLRKASDKFVAAVDDVAARGLDINDPRSFDE